MDKTAYWLDLCNYDLETAKAMQKTKRFLYVGLCVIKSPKKVLKP